MGNQLVLENLPGKLDPFKADVEERLSAGVWNAL
jgi:hypothetical protein